MKKVTILMCIFLGLHFAACNSKTAAGNGSDSSSAAGTQSAGRKEDAQEAAEIAGEKETSAEENRTDHLKQTMNADMSAQQDTVADLKDLKRHEDAVPVVYMTNEVSAEALLHLYHFTGWELAGEHTAVHISTGGRLAESGLEPELLYELVAYTDGTITISNPAQSDFTMSDRQLKEAEELGFTEVADVVVLDQDGVVLLPVEEGMRLAENEVGSRFLEYDGILAVSHFQRHAAAGFSGAVQNISLGVSSSQGKCLICSAGSSRTDATVLQQEAFMEAMAEAGKSVSDALNKNIYYINVMDHATIGCGCGTDSYGEDLHDIGILACEDPVALDQACVDFIYTADANESFVEGLEAADAEYVLEYAEEVGLGNSAYTLVTID